MQPQTNQQDTRRLALDQWVQTSLGEPVRGEVASADASFRRYFRYYRPDGSSLIAMDAPPEHENSAPFVAVAGRLAAAGVAVPQILAADLTQGFLLLSDLGRETWLHVLDEHNADALFERALKVLLDIQNADVSGLPDYDEALLRRELALFPDWYLDRHLAGRLGDSARAELGRLLVQVDQQLVCAALDQAQVFVHRDYMPRNLMEGPFSPGVLDFQDAVRGPVSYDAVSLFRDAFISWPEARVSGWLGDYWALARDRGLPVPDSRDRFLRDCDLMGAQRHLKIMGIFARITHRDGKPRYVTDTPRFAAYLDTVAARYEELAPLRQVLTILTEEGVHG